MQTLNDLVTAIKGFILDNVGSVDIFQGERTELDVESALELSIVVSINNARRWAERKHDFSFKLTNSLVNVPITGLDLYSVGFKTLKSVWLGSEPMNVITSREQEIRMQKKNQLGFSDTAIWTGDKSIAIIDGHVLKIYPTPTEEVEVTVKGYAWMDNYVWPAGSETTDWLINNGFDFLQWQSIIEMNHIVKIFVPRQEGSLAPPERLRDAAWESLLVCDSVGIEGGIWHG